MNLSDRPVSSSISSVSRLGSMDEMRYRSMPFTPSSPRRRSAKLSPVVRPKSPYIDAGEHHLAATGGGDGLGFWRTRSATGILREEPRANGMVQ